MNISRQIGWSNESNLLYQILKQLTKLTGVIFNLTPKYKVYTALLTQSGGDNPTGIDSGPVTKGVTYQISGIDGDFSNVGAPNNNDSTFFVAINDEVPNSYGTSNLKFNEGAPVVTVLENTIGNIWFTYTNVGNYGINNSELLFSADKTIAFNSVSSDPGNPTFVNITIGDRNSVILNNFDTVVGFIDGIGLINIEIRVYN